MDKAERMTRFSVRPLYMQVHDALILRITDGTWAPGTAIPNEIDLAHELGVSIGTVRRALEELEDKSVIVRRQGRGTFVHDPNASDAALRFSQIRDEAGSRIEGVVETQDSKSGEADAADANRLGVTHGAPVIRTTRTRSHKNHMFMWEQSTIPAALAPSFTGETPPPKLAELAIKNGLIIDHATEAVSVDKPPVTVAEALGVEPDRLLLRLDRTVYAVNERPIEWRVAFCDLVSERYAVVMS